MNARVPVLFLRSGMTRQFNLRPLRIVKAVGNGNGGNPNHDRLGRFTGSPTAHPMPPSDHVTTHGAARTWWAQNLGGKTLAIDVHFADKNKKPVKIKVRFTPNNDHAFTDDVGGKYKTGERAFDAKRAQSMSRIPQVIEYPKSRAVNHGAELFFEAPVNGEHYTVVLTWREAAKAYEFHSAHFKTAAQVRDLLARQDRKKEGPLYKSGSSGFANESTNLPDPPERSKPGTVFAGLRDAQRQGSPSGGYRPNGLGNGMHITSMPSALQKSTPAGANTHSPSLFARRDPIIVKSPPSRAAAIPILFFRSTP